MGVYFNNIYPHRVSGYAEMNFRMESGVGFQTEVLGYGSQVWILGMEFVYEIKQGKGTGNGEGTRESTGGYAGEWDGGRAA